MCNKNMNLSEQAIWLQTNAKFFPQEQTMSLKKTFEKMKEEEFLRITTLEYKDPTTMLLISIFLGGLGVDRFMLGETSMGILKLLTGGCCGILWLIDIFSISNKVKNYNFGKLQEVLGFNNEPTEEKNN